MTVGDQLPDMNDFALKEIKALFGIFSECGKSICNDIKTLDCTSPKQISTHLIPSLGFKIKKLQECVVALHKLCKSLRKEDIKCLPCCKS